MPGPQRNGWLRTRASWAPTRTAWPSRETRRAATSRRWWRNWRASTGPPIRFQLLWYPATTWDTKLPSFTENSGAPLLGGKAVRGLSRWYVGDLDLSDMPATLAPARAKNLAGLPPAYIAVAGHDPLRDDGARYAALLAAAGVPAELHNAETLIHGYLGYAGVVPAATDAMERGLSALREALHTTS